MKMLLQNISGDGLASIDVESSISFADLRNAIAASLSLGPRIVFSLILGERELQESSGDQSLTDMGIEEGAMLMVVKRPLVQVVTASRDGTAKIWSSSTGECLQTLAGHDHAVWSAVFSVDR